MKEYSGAEMINIIKEHYLNDEDICSQFGVSDELVKKCIEYNIFDKVLKDILPYNMYHFLDDDDILKTFDELYVEEYSKILAKPKEDTELTELTNLLSATDINPSIKLKPIKYKKTSKIKKILSDTITDKKLNKEIKALKKYIKQKNTSPKQILISSEKSIEELFNNLHLKN